MLTLGENQHLTHMNYICDIQQNHNHYMYLLMMYLLHIETDYNKHLHRCKDILSYT